MFTADKKPLGITSFELVFLLAFTRLPKGEIGYRVVPLEGGTISINIDWCYWGW